MAIQILGQDGSSIVAVDPNFDAMRVTLRPAECSGWYSFTIRSGLVTGVAANGPVWYLRYAPGTGKILMVKNINIGFATTTAFTAAQAVGFDLFFARSFTASDTGQTQATLTGDNGKHRTSMSTSGITGMGISNTAALTAGSRVLDIQPIGFAVGASTGVGTVMVPTPMLAGTSGEHPLILANNEGLVIQNSNIAMGAGGVIRLWVTVECAEMSAY